MDAQEERRVAASCAFAGNLFLPRLMSKAAHKEVTTKFFHTGNAAEPFVFSTGERLPGITVAYEAYGKLNASKSNAILLFHALSGSQHAAGLNTSVDGVGERWTEDCHHGWWDLQYPRHAASGGFCDSGHYRRGR